MENASKALIMAGSILLAMLVIGLLVFGYNELSSLEQTKEESKYLSKVDEYLLRFEQFNRGEDSPLYGSELLSLANLQEDYNLSEARIDVGYEKVKITVEIKETVDEEYFQAGKYDMEEIVKKRDELLERRQIYENTNDPKHTYKGKSVRYYSKKSYREIANDFDIDIPSDWGNDLISEELIINDKTKKLMQDIDDYNNIITIYNQFRTGKKFYCSNSEYDRYNGRLTSMTFTEKK